jgi:predicted O-linked N-acetylglucosamine transferase (SPINDLY family)
MSDALWCGCPAVALCGDTFASRVSTSVLAAADMSNLVAHSVDAYEALALELARSDEALQAARARVLCARDGSTLFDSARFTRDLEALYKELIDRAERAARQPG